MAQFERTDIGLEPSWPNLIFGDLYIAKVVGIFYGKNINGEDVIKFILIPTKELAKRHNILLEQLDDNMRIKVEYPLDMVKQISSDPAFPGYFCFLNFKGEECEGTRMWKGFQEMQKIMEFRKIIESLKAENAYLKEKLSKANTNMTKYIKEEVMGPVSEMTAPFLNAQIQQNQQMQPTGPVRQS